MKQQCEMQKGGQAEKYTEMEVLEANNAFYDSFADMFDKIPFDGIITGYFNKYATSAMGKKVLDIGSGPGALAKWIQSLGFSVLCVEPSDAMCQRCRARGLEVLKVAAENLKLNETFDHIFALSSLIHVLPEKLPRVLQTIEGLLADSGIVYCSFLLGDKCGMEDPTNSGKKRFFSRFSREEIVKMTEPLFILRESMEVEVKRMDSSFLIQVMQKREKTNRRSGI